MNGPSLLITGGAPAMGSSSAVAGDAPADDGFSSALASSIAGLVKQAQCAPDAALPPDAGDGSAATAESASLADVMQWLGLPLTGPLADAAAGAGQEPLQQADSSAAGSADEVLAAIANRLTGSRSAIDAGSEPADSEQGVGDLESGATPLDALSALEKALGTMGATAGASSAATPTNTPASPASILNTVAASLMREGLSAPAPGTTTPVRASLHESVGSARWAEELGSRLVLMSVRGQQEGSLTLTPEHLGPLEVQISVSKDTANVWFGAQHADTRAALTEALPRLRELLAASGLSLGQAGVSEQSPRRSAPEAEAARAASAGSVEGIGTSEALEPAWRAMRAGLIDTYA